VRGVEVLEVTGRLDAVVEDLDRAIQPALAEGPRGVVCDLSAVTESSSLILTDEPTSIHRSFDLASG